jgi:hypothetical protein
MPVVGETVLVPDVPPCPAEVPGDPPVAPLADAPEPPPCANAKDEPKSRTDASANAVTLIVALSLREREQLIFYAVVPNRWADLRRLQLGPHMEFLKVTVGYRYIDSDVTETACPPMVDWVGSGRPASMRSTAGRPEITSARRQTAPPLDPPPLTAMPWIPPQQKQPRKISAIQTRAS